MLTFLSVVVLGYVGVCALAYFAQDGMLFFPQSTDPGVQRQLAAYARTIETAGATLSGWVIPARVPDDAPLVFYFGGNAEDLGYAALEVERYGDATFVLMSYRGYGSSTGSPSEDALCADAVAIYDAIVAELGEAQTIIGFGRSLGTGIAIRLASERRVDALVLVSPYDSIRDVARRHYPWLPVGALIRHPFDSYALAPTLDLPALFVVAERDRIIPPAHSRRLFDQWAGAGRWMAIEGADHNSLGAQHAYWSTIREFIAAR